MGLSSINLGTYFTNSNVMCIYDVVPYSEKVVFNLCVHVIHKLLANSKQRKQTV